MIFDQLADQLASASKVSERAHATLLEHCSERQRDALPKLTVVVGAGEFKIAPYGSANAIVHKVGYMGFPAQTLVGSRMGKLPAADCMLAAKLLLEADATAFMREASRCGTVWLD